jgi:hypothetical protein
MKKDQQGFAANSSSPFCFHDDESHWKVATEGGFFLPLYWHASTSLLHIISHYFLILASSSFVKQTVASLFQPLPTIP